MRCLIKIKYPGYLEHKLEHQKILDDIAALKIRLFSSTDESAEQEPSIAITEQASSAQGLGAIESAEVENYDESSAVDMTSADSEVVQAVAKEVEVTEKETSAKSSPSVQVNEDVVALLRDWVLGHVSCVKN